MIPTRSLSSRQSIRVVVPDILATMLDIENGFELSAAVCCREKCAKVLIHGPNPPSLLIVATKSQCTIALGQGATLD